MAPRGSGGPRPAGHWPNLGPGAGPSRSGQRAAPEVRAAEAPGSCSARGRAPGSGAEVRRPLPLGRRADHAAGLKGAVVALSHRFPLFFPQTQPQPLLVPRLPACDGAAAAPGGCRLLGPHGLREPGSRAAGRGGEGLSPPSEVGTVTDTFKEGPRSPGWGCLRSLPGPPFLWPLRSHPPPRACSQATGAPRAARGRARLRVSFAQTTGARRPLPGSQASCLFQLLHVLSLKSFLKNWFLNIFY